MTKNIFKFLLGGLLVVLVGAAGLWVIREWNYKKSPEYQAAEKMRELERQYAEDPYGGDTPEETLRLFIEALKAGDTDLAAKYFVLEKQEEWKRDLALIKEKGLLDEMMRDLSRKTYKHNLSDTQTSFDIANDDREAILNILVTRGTNQLWKIIDM